MKTKLLFLFTIVIGMSIINAQSFSNLGFESEITTTSSVTLTFDFDEVDEGDAFEWQLFIANAAGELDWGVGRNVAYKITIVPNPSLDMLNISNKNLEIKRVQIFALNGEKVIDYKSNNKC